MYIRFVPKSIVCNACGLHFHICICSAQLNTSYMEL